MADQARNDKSYKTTFWTRVPYTLHRIARTDMKTLRVIHVVKKKKVSSMKINELCVCLLLTKNATILNIMKIHEADVRLNALNTFSTLPSYFVCSTVNSKPQWYVLNIISKIPKIMMKNEMADTEIKKNHMIKLGILK